MPKKKDDIQKIKLSVGDKNREIRNFINNSLIKKADIWNKKDDGFWSYWTTSMDVIDDTNIALNDFLTTTEKTFDKNPYIFTYGVLQALVMQQDAVSFLNKSIFNKEISYNKDYSELNYIRILRNETIGHPINTKRKGIESKYSDGEISTCFIDRNSMTKNGFKYFLYTKNNTEQKEIIFTDILKKQNDELSKILYNMLKKIKEEENNHKKKFERRKLSELLENNSLLSVYGINEVIDNEVGGLGQSSFDYLFKQFKLVKKGLNERYGNIESVVIRITGTQYLIKELDFIFKEIKFKIENKNKKDFKKMDFYIYADTLKIKSDELREHLIEIDKDFEI